MNSCATCRHFEDDALYCILLDALTTPENSCEDYYQDWRTKKPCTGVGAGAGQRKNEKIGCGENTADLSEVQDNSTIWYKLSKSLHSWARYEKLKFPTYRQKSCNRLLISFQKEIKNLSTFRKHACNRLLNLGRSVTSSIREDWRLSIGRGTLHPAFSFKSQPIEVSHDC